MSFVLVKTARGIAEELLAVEVLGLRNPNWLSFGPERVSEEKRGRITTLIGVLDEVLAADVKPAPRIETELVVASMTKMSVMHVDGEDALKALFLYGSPDWLCHDARVQVSLPLVDAMLQASAMLAMVRQASGQVLLLEPLVVHMLAKDAVRFEASFVYDQDSDKVKSVQGVPGVNTEVRVMPAKAVITVSSDAQYAGGSDGTDSGKMRRDVLVTLTNADLIAMRESAHQQQGAGP